jgi:hypothetical protein
MLVSRPGIESWVGGLPGRSGSLLELITEQIAVQTRRSADAFGRMGIGGNAKAGQTTERMIWT